MTFRFIPGRTISDLSKGLCYYDKPFQHAVIIGASGKGKTSLIQRLIHELPGGIIVLDPTGDLIDKVPQDFLLVDPQNPISINPLKRTYLDKSQLANEFAEILKVAVKTTSEDQMGSSVLMQMIFRNAINAGVDEFSDLFRLCQYDFERKKLASKTGNFYWIHFDDKLSPSYYKDKEAIDSAKRIAARLSLIVDDKNAFPFFEGDSEFNVKDVADKAQRYIFNLHGFDDFIVSLIGGSIASLIKSYYRNQATTSSPPLFFVCDEVQYFLTENFRRFFVDCRRYNISVNISLHSKEQLTREMAQLIEDTVHTKIILKDGYKADVYIGDEKEYKIKLFSPMEKHNFELKPAKQANEPENLNFLRIGWM